MRPIVRIVSASLALSALVACGDSKPDASKPAAGSTAAPTADPADPAAVAVKARLLALFDVVKAGGGAKAAEFIVYKGPDEARRYKSAAKYEGDEVRQIDRAVTKLKAHLDLGAPNFVSVESKTKGTEKWMAWKVRYGEGDAAKQALYAFIDVGGTWLLGDIDEIRNPSPTK